MAMVSFKKGLLANLPATKTAGTFYVTTDERAMYLDVNEDTRIRLGDFQEFANVAALTANPNPSTTALYYVSDINCLAKWNGSEYIQINKDTGMTSVEVTGDGNAITAAVYDAAGRKLTLTKGATYMTAADVDGKISDKVGTLKVGDTTYDTVVAYVNKKAEDTLAAAQGGSSETAASVKQALDSYKTENDAKVQANTDAIDAIEADYLKSSDKEALQASIDGKAAQSDLNSLVAKVGTVVDGKTVVGLISDAQTQADKGVADAAAAQADVDALEAKVGTVPEDKTVVQMIADAQDAATYDDTEVRGLISDNADAIATLNGTGAGSVSKQVADAVAQIVADAPEAYDTLKEISDWISSHASDAATMNSQINTNKTDIANLTALVGALPEGAASTTVVGYIDEAIAALKIGDYAKAADLTAAIDRIGAAEDKITTLEGKVKAIEDKNISDGANKVEASTTNGNIKIDGVETVVYTHPDAHAISEVTGLQDALDAKAAQTSLNATNANVTANANAITALQSGKADKATTLAGYGIIDAYTKTETYTKAEVESMLTWGTF